MRFRFFYLVYIICINCFFPHIAQSNGSQIVNLEIANTPKNTNTSQKNIITIGMENFPTSVIPLLATGSLSGQVSAQLFSSLCRLDKDGVLQPYLAKNVNYSSEFKSVTITLRPNIFFHDGNLITAKDVQFSIDAARQIHAFRTAFAQIKDIIIVDAKTIRIDFFIPQPHFMKVCIPSLMPILPEDIYGSVQGIQDAKLDSIVGSGPFQLESYNSSQIKLTKFPKFFITGRPFVDGIVFDVYNNVGDSYYRQAEQEIDILPFRWDLYSQNAIEQYPFLNVSQREYNNINPYFVIQFNLESPPFNNILVRKALSLAVDRVFLAENGFGRPTVPMYGPMTQNDPFYKTPNYDYKYDISKANELLDMAGFPRNEAGMRMTISVAVPPYISKTLLIVEYLQYTFSRTIGVDVVIDAKPNLAQWKELIVSGKYQSTIDELFSWHDPLVGMHRIYTSSSRRPQKIWSNTIFYEDKNVDKLLRQASMVEKGHLRKILYDDVQDTIGSNYTSLWLSSAPYVTVYNKRIDGLADLYLGTMSPMDNVYIKNIPKKERP